MSDRQALIARLRLALDFAAPRAWCEIGEDVVCECITALEEAQGVPLHEIADALRWAMSKVHRPDESYSDTYRSEFHKANNVLFRLVNSPAAPAAPTREPDEQDAAQRDLAEILHTVGLSDAARPYSPHEVVQRDLLPRLRALLRDEQDARRLRNVLRPNGDCYQTLMSVANGIDSPGLASMATSAIIAIDAALAEPKR